MVLVLLLMCYNIKDFRLFSTECHDENCVSIEMQELFLLWRYNQLVIAIEGQLSFVGS
jgi:hypothetical protein